MSKLGLVTTRRLSRFWTKGILPIKNSLQSHMDSTSIHVTTDEKESWSEKEVFIATYGSVTYNEIDMAYKAGKSCFIKFQQVEPVSLVITLPLVYAGNNEYYFSAYVYANDCVYTAYVSSDGSTGSDIYTLPPVTNSEDNGKVLKVKNGYPKWVSIEPTTSSITLVASSWDSSAKTYSFETDYPTATYDIEIALDSIATSEQAEAFNGAQIVGSATSNIIKAYGEVPTVDIPIIIKVVTK